MSNNNQFIGGAYSPYQPLLNVFPQPIIANRAPTQADKMQLGRIWDWSATNQVWILTSIVANLANWQLLAASSGALTLTSLTVTPGPVSLVATGSGAVTIGNAANAALVSLVAGPGGLSLIGAGNALNIGADAAASPIVIGNITGATSISELVGTGNYSLNGVGASTYTIGAATTTGTISIGGTAQTGIFTLAGGNGIQTINIANSTGVKTVNIATGAAANLVAIGSHTTAASTTINGGTGGIILSPTAGNMSAVPGTGTVAGVAITLNDRLGSVTFTGLTTASAASQTLTITNSTVETTSAILVSLSHLNASTNGALLGITDVTVALNSIALTYINTSANPLGAGDTVRVTFWVMN